MASILPVIVILFAGSISDQYGRKLPMITVLGGFVLYAIIYIITALNPSWPVQVLYAATIAVNATGSWVLFPDINIYKDIWTELISSLNQ